MKLPTERQWVTLGLYVLAMTMIGMGFVDRSLWDVELFKVIIQAVVISGFINMVLAFHFAANKEDEAKTENTRAAFEAITATAQASTPPQAAAAAAADQVADAATDEANKIKDGP